MIGTLCGAPHVPTGAKTGEGESIHQHSSLLHHRSPRLSSSSLVSLHSRPSHLHKSAINIPSSLHHIQCNIQTSSSLNQHPLLLLFFLFSRSLSFSLTHSLPRLLFPLLSQGFSRSFLPLSAQTNKQRLRERSTIHHRQAKRKSSSLCVLFRSPLCLALSVPLHCIHSLCPSLALCQLE